MGISQHTISWLRQQGFDAIHLRVEGLQRLPDNEFLAKAATENRVLLTMDLDFGYLAAISKLTLPGVIIFRIKNNNSAVATRLQHFQ